MHRCPTSNNGIANNNYYSFYVYIVFWFSYGQSRVSLYIVSDLHYVGGPSVNLIVKDSINEHILCLQCLLTVHMATNITTITTIATAVSEPPTARATSQAITAGCLYNSQLDLFKLWQSRLEDYISQSFTHQEREQPL